MVRRKGHSPPLGPCGLCRDPVTTTDYLTCASCRKLRHLGCLSEAPIPRLQLPRPADLAIFRSITSTLQLSYTCPCCAPEPKDYKPASTTHPAASHAAPSPSTSLPCPALSPVSSSQVVALHSQASPVATQDACLKVKKPKLPEGNALPQQRRPQTSNHSPSKQRTYAEASNAAPDSAYEKVSRLAAQLQRVIADLGIPRHQEPHCSASSSARKPHITTQLDPSSDLLIVGLAEGDGAPPDTDAVSTLLSAMSIVCPQRAHWRLGRQLEGGPRPLVLRLPSPSVARAIRQAAPRLRHNALLSDVFIRLPRTRAERLNDYQLRQDAQSRNSEKDGWVYFACQRSNRVRRGRLQPTDPDGSQTAEPRFLIDGEWHATTLKAPAGPSTPSPTASPAKN